MPDDKSQTTGPKIEAVALAKAADAWASQTSWDWSSDGLEAACQAFHEHMAQGLRGLLQDVVDDMTFNVAPSRATMAKIKEALQ